MIIVTEKRALKKNPSAACCLLLSNLWNRSCISFHMCRFFANCTLLLLYPQKREGKWENKINALQLSISWLDLIMRICSIMSNVQKWFCNTQTFFLDFPDFYTMIHHCKITILVHTQKSGEILVGRKVDKSLLFCDIFGIILGQKTNNLEEEKTPKKCPCFLRKKTFFGLVLFLGFVNCLMLCRILVES